MQVSIKKLSPEVSIPTYSRNGDACLDLRAYLPNDEFAGEYTIIESGETKLIPTGIKIEHIPEGYKLCVVARSGMALKGLQVANGVGQVDENYRGEIKVIMFNASQESIQIESGDRIAQLYLEKVIHFELIEGGFKSETNRGENGFNSSGVK